MPDNTNPLWWVEQAESYRGAENASLAYAGELNDSNGFAGVRELVLQEASQQIRERIESGTGKVAAFNYETSEWPHRARGWLARYEELRTDRQDDEYIVQEYADAADIPDEITMQTTLDTYYDADVFNDLDRGEARALLYARCVDGDINEEELVDEIGSPGEFINSLDRVGNVTAAIHRQHFDSTVPDAVLQEAAPPDEWNTDPSRISESVCTSCGEHLFSIETESDREWVDANGRIHDNTVNTETTENIRHLTGDDGLLCGVCMDIDWSNQPNIGAFLADGIVSGSFYDGFIKSDGYGSSVSILTDSECRFLYDLEYNGRTPSEDYTAATASGSLPSEAPQILAEAVDSLESGPAFFARGQVFVPRDEPEVVAEVKSLLEDEFADFLEVPA